MYNSYSVYIIADIYIFACKLYMYVEYNCYTLHDRITVEMHLQIMTSYYMENELIYDLLIAMGRSFPFIFARLHLHGEATPF